MSQGISRTAVPALLCIIAVAALVAAGFMLFESRHDLRPAEPAGNDSSFVSFSAEAEPAFDDQFTAEEGWEILEPVSPRDEEPPREEPADEKSALVERNAPPPSDIGESNRSRARRGNARLVVITNFTRANVTINGDIYPSYSDDGQNRGMSLPSGEEHEVRVEFDGRERFYRITLRPGERRLLMVELTGMRASGATPERPRPDRRARAEPEEEDDAEDEEGRITVYSRPRGTIFVGNNNMNEQTPGTVEVDAGRHEVQVRYEDGEMSETKVVRVREGSRIKLFFRQDE